MIKREGGAIVDDLIGSIMVGGSILSWPARNNSLKSWRTSPEFRYILFGKKGRKLIEILAELYVIL